MSNTSQQISVIGLILLLASGCGGDKPPEGWTKNQYDEYVPQLDIPPPLVGSNTPKKEQSKLPEVFTRGSQSFFSHSLLSPHGRTTLEGAQKAFLNENYAEAESLFFQAYEENRNNPETLIFYNNSLAWGKSEGHLTLAVVVPADNEPEKSLEILRGVAQSQDMFNQDEKGKLKPLEIIIVKDGNNVQQVTEVAEMIVSESSILGVIGHSSSGNSGAALSIYTDHDVTMIAPTSTSTDLEGAHFFRTVPSDQVTGTLLARYARDNLNISKIAIFYDKSSSYSRSIKTAFQREFKRKGGNTFILDIKDKDVKQDFKEEVRNENITAAALFPGIKQTSILTEIAQANSELEPNQRVQLLGADSLYSPDTLSGNEENIEGMILVVPWFREAPESKKFSQSSATQWAGRISWRTALSFDATQAFIDAITQEDVARNNLHTSLANVMLSKNDTSGDDLDFSIGKSRKKAVLVEVRNSQYSYVDGYDINSY